MDADAVYALIAARGFAAAHPSVAGADRMLSWAESVLTTARLTRAGLTKGQAAALTRLRERFHVDAWVAKHGMEPALRAEAAAVLAALANDRGMFLD
jgi:hypothetical protein